MAHLYLRKDASATGEPRGGLAQLARASALQAEGQRFDSVILHHRKEHIDKAGSEFSEPHAARRWEEEDSEREDTKKSKQLRNE